MFEANEFDELHLRPDEIDTNRTARLLTVLDQWERGTGEQEKAYSVWHVLHDVLEIMGVKDALRWHETDRIDDLNEREAGDAERLKRKVAPLRPLKRPGDPEGMEENRRIAKAFEAEMSPVWERDEKRRWLPYIKPAVLTGRSESLKEDIGRLREIIADDITIDAYGTALCILRAIHQEPENPLNAAYNDPFQEYIEKFEALRESQKAEQRNDDDFVPVTLDPEPEAVTKARIQPQIDAFREALRTKGLGNISITGIEAHDTGSALIEPLKYNYNFLPEGPYKEQLFKRGKAQKQALDEYYRDHKGADWDYEDIRELEEKHRFWSDDEFPYFDFETGRFIAERGLGHKENAYGTIAARITTYDVSFRTKNQEDLQSLADLVNLALVHLKETEQAFCIPPDSIATMDAYTRENQAFINNGKVALKNRLSLDDFVNLYYLLEDVIEGSPETAQTMNYAPRAEARSSFMELSRKLTWENAYSSDNASALHQRGRIKPGKTGMDDVLRDLFTLASIGQIDQSNLLKASITLANATLSGQFAIRALPTRSQMNEVALRAGTEIAPYGEALRDRTEQMLRFMTGASAEGNVGNALLQSITAERPRIIAALQQEAAHAREQSRPEMKLGGFDPFTGFKEKSEEERKALIISDANAGYKEEDKPKDNDNALERRDSLALRDAEVEPCIDRTYRDQHTLYTGRPAFSPWVRYEMPAKQKPHLAPEPDHDPVRQVYLSFTPRPAL